MGLDGRIICEDALAHLKRLLLLRTCAVLLTSRSALQMADGRPIVRLRWSESEKNSSQKGEKGRAFSSNKVVPPVVFL
jgi:hypothetical protein